MSAYFFTTVGEKLFDVLIVEYLDCVCYADSAAANGSLFNTTYPEWLSSVEVLTLYSALNQVGSVV